MPRTAVMQDASAHTSTVPVVLVIDDDPPLRRMLSLTLRDGGFAVLPAGDGQAALDLLAADPSLPDAIVLDLEMPVMDGRAFYRALRERGILVPVIVVSAYGARSAQRQLGAESYLDKPFSPDELVNRVRSLLRPAA